ncbi:MAG: hypothetical protein KOO60_04510 [Gemmatimonadales bacterium]|nr:hypothetical protein [Gemmatimonadales bacterium]
MSYLKTPFVLIPIFATLVLLVGIRYFNTFSASSTNPLMIGLFPLLMLAFVGVWVMYFVVGAVVKYFGRPSSRKLSRAEDTDFV